MTQIYVARISPQAKTLTFTSPFVPGVTFHKNLDPRDSSKGWVAVSEEQAAYLIKIKIGGSSNPRAPALMDVCTQEQAMRMQQIERAKSGLGGADNPIGGNPIQQHEINLLRGEVAEQKAQNAQILAFLKTIAEAKSPAIAEQLMGVSPNEIGLALSPGVSPPLSRAESEEAAAAARSQVAAKPVQSGKVAPSAPAAGAQQATKTKPRIGQGPMADPNDAVAQARARGTIPSSPAEDEGEGSAATA